jgi:Protein of unknown function (DUF3102)
MMNIVTLTPDVNPDNTLEEHAAAIRNGLREIEIQMRNALRISFKVGGHLIYAKQQVAHGQWKKWLKKNCFLSHRTAQLYMQIAECRDVIEDELVVTPELSVRAAAKLIAKPSESKAKDSDAVEPDQEEPDQEEPDQEEPDAVGGEGAPPDRAADLLAAWEAASIAERKDFINSIKLPGIIEAMSSGMLDALMTRAETSRRLRKKANKKPTVIEGTATHIN